MVDAIKGIRVTFVVVHGKIFGYPLGIGTTVVMVADPRLRSGMVNDRLFDSTHLEPDGMGIHRLVVVEIDPPVENGPGYDSPVFSSIIDL